MNTTIITQTHKKQQRSGGAEEQRRDVFPLPPRPPAPLPASFPQRRARATSHNYDPWDRLLHAIALQAVKDMVKPAKIPWLTHEEHETAYWFIGHFQTAYEALGIPSCKIESLLRRNPANDPLPPFGGD